MGAEAASLQAILWDNDGILVDTEPLYFRANREELAARGVELTREIYQDLSLRQGRGCVELLRDRGAGEDEVEAMRQARNRRYESFLAEGVEVMSGAEDCLRALHGRLPMAIVTSAPRKHFDLIHERLDLQRFFQFSLTPDLYDRHKPHPEPYLRGAEKLGVDPARCLVVEDSERGLQSALAAGMRCVVVPHELTENGGFASAHAVLPHLGELPALVEALLA